MAQPNNGNPGKLNHGSQQQNDKKENYSHSNQDRRDNRSDTRDHEYKDYDKTLTNDENYNLDNDQIKGDPDFSDKTENASNGNSNPGK